MLKLLRILFLMAIPGFCSCFVAGAQGNYTSSSVLASGKWFKIAVTEDGIFRIDFSELKRLGLEDPSNPRIFANNAGQLSYYNDGTAPDDLREISVFASTGNDGIFNDGDFLLFYGQGTGRWLFDSSSGDFSYLRHNYSDTAYYFLTSGGQAGKRISSAPITVFQPDHFSSSSDMLFIHEEETENLLHSGREWYQPVSSVKETAIIPGFIDLKASDRIKYKLRVLARSSTSTSFRLSENGSTICNVTVPGIDPNSSTGIYAQPAFAEGDFSASSASPAPGLQYINNGNPAARGWIDYLILHARKNNRFDGKTSFYMDSRATGQGFVTEFTIGSSVGNVIVWDVTNPFSAEIIPYSVSGTNLIFRVRTDSLRQFAAFTLNSTMMADRFKPVTVQDLHSSAPADMIIVTHPLFMSYATALAGIHKDNSGLISLVVTPEQIYNEFSGGTPDIAAIRNFIRMKYLTQKNTSRPLKYLLLFGDGSYNNRMLPPDNPNFVITYQSQNSNVRVSSFTSDDFYGLLDDREGEETGTEDVGIGRIPVYDTAGAGIAVAKISRYLNNSFSGDWKNVVCITADDEDGNTHVSDAEGLAGIVGEKAPWINLKKIYFDSFRQETTATGQFYPGVVQSVNEQINAGSLIFDYIGHGNETSLGHERVVTPESITAWKNIERLPLFITATCEFSRFDDAETNIATGVLLPKNSSGENILLKEDGGAIALMSTTRLVYSAPNYVLNKNIFEVAFGPDTDGSALRLGDIIRLAKNKSGSNTNKRNFVLLGDPAIRLSWPWQGKIITDSINNFPVSGYTDTLKALSVITVSGHAADFQGNPINDFNGRIEAIAFDKQSEKQTLANDGGQKFPYRMYENILFSGKTTALNGRFRFSFIVPRDMDYEYGKGKISYYASDGTNELTGYYSDIIAGGFSNETVYDNEGPSIRLFLNDTLFRNGGIAGSDPRLYAVLEDLNGINISGTGIGHDITCRLDNDKNKSFILNSYFDFETGSYKKGTIDFRLSGLAPGRHSLTLRAWDNYNNSSERSLEFIVGDEDRFILRNLISYPNPFTNSTKITAEHNRPDELLNIKIEIFNTGGKLIRTLNETAFPTGYRLYPVEWDGRVTGGAKAGSGLYPYRLTVVARNGETATITGRMIIY